VFCLAAGCDKITPVKRKKLPPLAVLNTCHHTVLKERRWWLWTSTFC